MLGESISAYTVSVPESFAGRSNQNAVKRGNSSGRGNAVSTAKRARRQSVLARIAAHGAKIAGAEEGGHVVLPVRHELHAKAREARVIAHRSAGSMPALSNSNIAGS